MVAITGRGPLKQAYEAEFARTPLSRVHIRTLWLEADEYPRVLAAADLGLCLHASSSGLDLPMKIADLFGVHVPVLAFDYGDCLREVVQPGVNGLLFKTADELAGCLETTLGDSGGARPELERLRAGARRPTALHWNEAWRLEARTPLIG